MDKCTFPNGIHDITNEQYHASNAYSRSQLWHLTRSPLHFQSALTDKPKETEAMLLGSLVHMLSLEPHLFKEQYVVAPKVNRTTKAGKEAWQLFCKEAGSKQLVQKDIYEQALAMATSLVHSTEFNEMGKHAKFEQSIYFTDSRSGLQFKVRPDMWRGPLIGDVKTSADASFQSMQNSVIKYGYALQAGMIKEALSSLNHPMEGFVIFAVEKTPPYATAVYVLDDELIKFGVEQFHSLVETLVECQEKKSYPSYGVRTLYLPSWASL